MLARTSLDGDSVTSEVPWMLVAGDLDTAHSRPYATHVSPYRSSDPPALAPWACPENEEPFRFGVALLVSRCSWSSS